MTRPWSRRRLAKHFHCRAAGLRAAKRRSRAVDGVDLHDRARRDARARRRVGLRQVDDRPPAAAADRAERGRGAVRRRWTSRRSRSAEMRRMRSGACRSSSRTLTARSIRADGRRAVDGGVRDPCGRRSRAERWRRACRDARPGAPAALGDAALPARVLRRPAPAHRHRPRARAAADPSSSATRPSRRSTSRCRRRSSTCCRSCSASCTHLPVHLAQPRGRAAHLRPDRRDVSRPHRRGRRGRRVLRAPVASLHAAPCWPRSRRRIPMRRSASRCLPKTHSAPVRSGRAAVSRRAVPSSRSVAAALTRCCFPSPTAAPSPAIGPRTAAFPMPEPRHHAKNPDRRMHAGDLVVQPAAVGVRELPHPARGRDLRAAWAEPGDRRSAVGVRRARRRRGGCGDLGPLGERRAAVGRRLAQAFRRDHRWIRATIERVDAVYFSLHGAMGADGELDPEGWLLQETRAIAGNKPIVDLARPARHPHRPDAAAGRRRCDLLDLSACRFRRYRAARGRAPAAADRPEPRSRRSRASSSRRWCAATS